MGTIIKLNCKCGYKAELFSGTGMLGCNPRIIMETFPEGVIKLLEKLGRTPVNAEDIAKGKNTDLLEGIILSNGILSCPHCKKFSTTPVINYYNEDGSSISVARETCESCGNTGFLVHETDFKCPVCNSDMDVEDIGMWD